MITYQKSGDAGFPHKKYQVKSKLGQGATAKVFKVVNYRGGIEDHHRMSKSPDYKLGCNMIHQRSPESDLKPFKETYALKVIVKRRIKEPLT